jgi:hypothetical protein
MLGAFGAHGLKQRIADPARIANWGTAAQYQVRVYPHKTEIKPAFLFFILAFAFPVDLSRSVAPYYPCSLTLAAHPLLRLNLHRCARATEHAGYGSLHSGYVDVQWIYLPTCFGSRAVQVLGTRDAVGGTVFDWRVGCACGEGEACFAQGAIEMNRIVGEERRNGSGCWDAMCVCLISVP